MPLNLVNALVAREIARNWAHERPAQSAVRPRIEAQRGDAPRRTPLPPRESALNMAASLRAEGVAISDSSVEAIGASPRRIAALRTLDFMRSLCAFGRIKRIATARTLLDGTPSAPLAADLFTLAGTARVGSSMRCYARTTHSLYTAKRMGEFARIVGELAVSGRVELAGGDVLVWDPRRLSIAQGRHADVLWGAVNHLAKSRSLPSDRTLNARNEYNASGELEDRAQYAYRGEMANLMTRLTGKVYVNVDGWDALSHLNSIIATHGPVLAEYGRHGGSVAKVERGEPLSIEGGHLVPEPVNDSLGYVVVPRSEARERYLSIIQYSVDDSAGYMARLEQRRTH
jgi:hypothetical protein